MLICLYSHWFVFFNLVVKNLIMIKKCLEIGIYRLRNGQLRLRRIKVVIAWNVKQLNIDRFHVTSSSKEPPKFYPHQAKEGVNLYLLQCYSLIARFV